MHAAAPLEADFHRKLSLFTAEHHRLQKCTLPCIFLLAAKFFVALILKKSTILQIEGDEGIDEIFQTVVNTIDGSLFIPTGRKKICIRHRILQKRVGAMQYSLLVYRV